VYGLLQPVMRGLDPRVYSLKKLLQIPME
jgi:hypothetical protein